MAKTIETDIQMRFADVDMLGHVNNVNQQHYFDLGKNEYMSEVLGIKSFRPEQGLITAATSTDYSAQIRMGEAVYVETSVERTGGKSFVFYQRLVSRETGEVKTESRSVMVAFDFASQVSIPVPEDWKEKI